MMIAFGRSAAFVTGEHARWRWSVFRFRAFRDAHAKLRLAVRLYNALNAVDVGPSADASSVVVDPVARPCAASSASG
eukprot:772384-Lingulodinium_polyedra.AAC.1